MRLLSPASRTTALATPVASGAVVGRFRATCMVRRAAGTRAERVTVPLPPLLLGGGAMGRRGCFDGTRVSQRNMGGRVRCVRVSAQGLPQEGGFYGGEGPSTLHGGGFQWEVAEAKGAAPRTYTTKKDDESLLSIAASEKLSLEGLCSVNPEYAKKYASRIPKGTRIQLPASASAHFYATENVQSYASQLRTGPLSKAYSTVTFVTALVLAGVLRGGFRESKGAKGESAAGPGGFVRGIARKMVQEELGSMSTVNKSLSSKVQRLEAALKNRDKTIQEYKQQSASRSTDLQTYRDTIRGQEQKIFSLQKIISLNNEKISNLESKYVQSEAESQASEYKASKLEEKINKLAAEVDSLVLAKDMMEKRGQLLKESRDDVRNELERVMADRNRLDEDLAALRVRTYELTQMSDKLQSSYNKATSENISLRARIETDRVRTKELERAKANVSLEQQDMNRQVAQLSNMLEMMQGNEKALEQALSRTRDELASMSKVAQARLEQLNAQIASVADAAALQGMMQKQVEDLKNELKVQARKLEEISDENAALKEGSGSGLSKEQAEAQAVDLMRTAEQAQRTSEEARNMLEAVTMQLEQQRMELEHTHNMNRHLEETIQDMESDFSLAATVAERSLAEAVHKNEELQQALDEKTRQLEELLRKGGDGTSGSAAPAPPADLPSTVQHDNGRITPSLTSMVREQQQQQQHRVTLHLVMGSHTIPHAEKAHFGGEDACFVDSSIGALGVADGVGGWSEEGVTSRDYAIAFLEACKNAMPSDGTSPEALCRTLDTAHRATSMPGSATVCLLKADPSSGMLNAANLGDSGFRVVRGGQVVCTSDVQEVEWNMPFQFGHPDHLPDTNLAEDAALTAFELREGDVIVAGSDGLFDNMFDDEICEGVGGLNGAVDAAIVQLTCNAIAAQAQQKSAAQQVDTPWAREVMERAGGGITRRGAVAAPPAIGGKVDDITVVIALVQRA